MAEGGSVHGTVEITYAYDPPVDHAAVVMKPWVEQQQDEAERLTARVFEQCRERGLELRGSYGRSCDFVGVRHYGDFQYAARCWRAGVMHHLGTFRSEEIAAAHVAEFAKAHPMIRRTATALWTPEMDAQLVAARKEVGSGAIADSIDIGTTAWEAIADSIDIGKTAHQCRQRFKASLTDERSKVGAWSPEEETRLDELVAGHLGTASERNGKAAIPWQKLAAHFPGRVANQLSNKHLCWVRAVRVRPPREARSRPHHPNHPATEHSAARGVLSSPQIACDHFPMRLRFTSHWCGARRLPQSRSTRRRVRTAPRSVVAAAARSGGPPGRLRPCSASASCLPLLSRPCLPTRRRRREPRRRPRRRRRPRGRRRRGPRLRPSCTRRPTRRSSTASSVPARLRAAGASSRLALGTSGHTSRLAASRTRTRPQPWPRGSSARRL